MGREKDDRGNGKEKRLEASGTSSSLPLLGLSLKLKIILVVTAGLLSTCCVPGIVLRSLHVLLNPNNQLATAINPGVELKKPKPRFSDNLSNATQLICHRAKRQPQAASLQNPFQPLCCSRLYLHLDNVERKGLCNLWSNKALSFSGA